jgi:hypothetical protein
MILRFIPKKYLWKEIFKREGFSDGDDVELSSTMKLVFSRNPDFRHLLKKREILLLKSLTLVEKDPEFTKGQIAENRLWQAFDLPMEPEFLKVAEKKLVEVDKTSFLDNWKHASKKQPSKSKDDKHS